MPFRPAVDFTLETGQGQLRFTEHPAAKNMPYGQTGRRATVYQVQTPGGGFQALKVFTQAFRSPRYAQTAGNLARYASLAGLQVCARTVFTPETHAALLREHPDLSYAVLMPWISGQTWQEILLGGAPLTPAQSRSLAQGLSRLLAGLEANALAHCDLAGPNLLLPGLAEAVNGSQGSGVELVDVEDLYGPGLPQPQALPGGSAGYGHRTAAQGLWCPEADRFAAAVLLAEILGWCDESVRRVCYGEQFFDPAELQTNSERFQLLYQMLREYWGQAIAGAFGTAWHSASLVECPTLGEWDALLNASVTGEVEVTAGQPKEERKLSPTAEIIYQTFQAELGKRNWPEAERLSQALKILEPWFTETEIQLQQAAAVIEDERRLQAELGQAQQEIGRRMAGVSQERAALEGERQALEAQMQALLARDEALKKKEEQRALLEHRLQEARRLLGEHQPGEARQALGDLLPPPAPPPVPAPAPVTVQVSQPASAAPAAAAFQAAAAIPEAPIPLSLKLKVKEIYEPKRAGISLGGGASIVMDIQFSPNGQYLATALSGRTIHLWSAVSGMSRAWKSGTAVPTRLAFTPDGSQLVVGDLDMDGTVRVWDLFRSEDVFRISETRSSNDAAPVKALGFSPDGKTLVVATATAVTEYTFSGGAIGTKTNLTTLTSVLRVDQVAYTAEGQYMAVGRFNGVADLYQLPNPQPLHTLNQKIQVTALALRPNATLLATGDVFGEIWLWDNCAAPLPLFKLRRHTSKVSRLAFSPDGQLLASCSEDGTAAVWRTRDGSLLAAADPGTGKLSCLAFHPKGMRLAAGSEAGSVVLWEIDRIDSK